MPPTNPDKSVGLTLDFHFCTERGEAGFDHAAEIVTDFGRMLIFRRLRPHLPPRFVVVEIMPCLFSVPTYAWTCAFDLPSVALWSPENSK